jgi:hypothetical protein
MLKVTMITNYLTLSAVYAAPLFGIDKNLCLGIASGCYALFAVLAVRGH